MTSKCNQCAIPDGETTCVTCGTPAVEIVQAGPLEVTRVKEGVEIEAAPCGICGEMTIGRIESPDGK